MRQNSLTEANCKTFKCQMCECVLFFAPTEMSTQSFFYENVDSCVNILI